jgi:DNA topoisomerase-2
MSIKTIEQKYLSMSQEQHILMRPDTYIGDTQLLSDSMYVFNDELNKIVKGVRK